MGANGPGGGPQCSLGTSNCYDLQINTNQFSTTYASSGGPITTTGSEQYVYQDGGSSAIMGIWVILYGFSTCPSPSPSGYSAWDLYLGNCYAHSPFIPVPPVPVTALSTVTMTAYANQSGNDSLVFCANPAISGWPVCTPTSASDAIGLSYAWTVAEFNVFGDNGGSQAAFNGGAALQVQTQIATEGGGALVPTCAGQPGYHTVEDNNLYLWPCSASSSGILFWEANESFGLSATPASATVQPGQPATYAVGFSSFSGVPAPVQLSVISPLPAGVTSSFPTTITPPAEGVLTLTTSPATPLGDYALTIQSQIASLVGGPGPTATTTVDLHVFNFTVSISPASQTVVRGLSAPYTIELSLDPGSSLVGLPPVVLADPGLPGDASTSGLNPSGYALGSPIPTTVPFVVYTAPAPTGSLGDFSFTITGTAQGYPAGAESASAALHIFDFTVSLSPTTLTLTQGSSAVVTVSVGLVAGSSTVGLPSVSLTLAGVPSGITASGFPSSLGIPGSQTFTLSTAGSGGYVSCPQVSDHGGQYLPGANLAHCNLAGYNLKGADLYRADLKDANLAGANFLGADLVQANLSGANTPGANFELANLFGAYLTAAPGTLGTFSVSATGVTQGVARAASLTVTVLGEQLAGVNFLGANLQVANLAGDQLQGAVFDLANLLATNLPDANLTHAQAELANLAWADLAGANLASASLELSNFAGADLAGADLVSADLEWDYLVSADLAGADAAYANFEWANLAYADLMDANLSYANLQWANLWDANLTGANLTGANLHGAIL